MKMGNIGNEHWHPKLVERYTREITEKPYMFATKTGWRKRGYAPLNGVSPAVVGKVGNRKIVVYHYEQVWPIQGQKAFNRREEWKNQLVENQKVNNERKR